MRGPDPISAIGSAFLNYRLIRRSFREFFTLRIFDFLPEDPLFEKQIKISRTDLYERVWTTPLRTLAKEFGLSDVGLAKLCRRHGIPLPGRGYWVRMQFGKKQERTALPDAKDATAETIVIIAPESRSYEKDLPPGPSSILTFKFRREIAESIQLRRR